METFNNFYQAILNNLHDGICVINDQRKIVFWNQTCEQLTGYQKSDIINRSCQKVFNPIDEHGINLCQNGCPVARTLEQGIIKIEEIYLHHKEGHRIPIKTKVTPITNQQGTIKGAIQVLADNSEKIDLVDKLNRMKGEAQLDKLTQIGNRKFVQTRIQERLEELTRYGWQFGILFIDLDNFKQINDTYGHNTGDKVLTIVARTIEKELRSFDTVGRWGGDEFIAIIVNISSKNLFSVANRLRQLINNSYLTRDKAKIKISPSIGGTTAAESDSVDSLINRADNAMYTSKQQGKNKVTIV